MVGRDLPSPPPCPGSRRRRLRALRPALQPRPMRQRRRPPRPRARYPGLGGDHRPRVTGAGDLQLIKITGSAFADFARDEHTTLPERPDRPLYIWTRHRLEVRRCVTRRAGGDPRPLSPPSRLPTWQSPSSTSSSASRSSTYVNEIGIRMLDRWPQLAEVSLRCPEPAVGRRGRIPRRPAREVLRGPSPAVRAHRAGPAPRLGVPRGVAPGARIGQQAAPDWPICAHRAMFVAGIGRTSPVPSSAWPIRASGASCKLLVQRDPHPRQRPSRDQG